MDNFTQKYNIDRKAAGKLLKVSTRTVDRYIKKKVLTAQSIGGRIWLSKDDVLSLGSNKMLNSAPAFPTYDSGAQSQTYSPIDTSVDMSTPGMTIDIVKDNSYESNENVSTSQQQINVKEALESQVYKKMYQETKGELNEKIERLEIANYRVGQLEAQLKNTIPLLEYHREASEKKLEKARLIEKIEYADNAIKALSQKLRFEKYNKRVVFTVLLIILALQPLWLLILQK